MAGRKQKYPIDEDMKRALCYAIGVARDSADVMKGVQGRLTDALTRNDLRDVAKYLRQAQRDIRRTVLGDLAVTERTLREAEKHAKASSARSEETAHVRAEGA